MATTVQRSGEYCNESLTNEKAYQCVAVLVIAREKTATIDAIPEYSGEQVMYLFEMARLKGNVSDCHSQSLRLVSFRTEGCIINRGHVANNVPHYAIQWCS